MTAEPSAADLRAVAVAKLKRAASLPRMKDGRRPPMRDDAVVSEGDKATTANAEGDAEDQEQPISENATDVEQWPPRAPSSTKVDENTAVTEDEPPPSGRDTPSRKRRGRSRSRSRSRSRGSKDFKEAKELFRPTDSSPEELPPIPFFQPTLASPIPSHFTNIPPFNPRNFLSPSPHPFLNPAASPPPTLDALREGLIRSNSARQMAFHKLVGGRDSPTTPTPSTTPPPFGGRGGALTRANTVTGVERSTARNLMLRRLEKRAQPRDGGESELTSGTDDAAPSKPATPSLMSDVAASKRVSPAVSNVIDDRDLPGSPTLSPRHTPSPLGATMTHAERKHQETLAKLTGDDPFEYDSPTRRPPPSIYPQQHSVVIEDDYIDPPQHASTTVPSPYNDDLLRPARSHLPSELSSTDSMHSNTDTERVPFFMQEEGQKSPYEQDTFPVTISPVGTPSRDRDVPESVDEDVTEDNVVYRQPDEMRDRKAYLTRLQRETEAKLSWIGADDGINLNSIQAAHRDPAPLQSSTSESDDVAEDHAEAVEEEPRASEESLPPTTSTPRLNLVPPSAEFARAESGMLYPQSSEARVSRGDEYQSSAAPETPSTINTFANGSIHVPSEKASEDDMPPANTRVSTASSSSLVLVEKPRTPAGGTRERGYSEAYTDYEDGMQTDAQTDREGFTDHESSQRTDRSPARKKRERGSAKSHWDRFTAGFTGRRSRSNSFARPKREDAATPSRESGASVKSDQSNHIPPPAPQSTQPAPNHSSTTSLLSLSANIVPPPRGGFSPIPPISAADMAKYTNPKLNPMPGIERLKEERRVRTRKLSTSAASDAAPGTVPNTRVNSPEPGLVHQASDSNIWAKYRSSIETPNLGDETDYEGGRITPGYIDLAPMVPRSPTPNGTPSKPTLPQTKEAALKWIQRRKEGKVVTTDVANGTISDSGTVRQGGKRKTLSDLIANGRGNDSGTERDDRSSAATPRPSGRRKALEQLRKLAGSPAENNGVSLSYSMSSSSSRSPTDKLLFERPSLDDSVDAARRANGHVSAASTSSYNSNASESISPTMITFPTTPPLNIATRSPQSPTTPTTPMKSALAKPSQPKVPTLMQRFKSLFSDSEPTVPPPVGPAPRKFIMASLVRQVISPNEVKNRFLLLFSDILVIAKFQDDDASEPSLSRTLAVRSIIELRGATIQVPQARSHDDFMRLPSIRSLVQDFSANPDEAIARCAQRTALTTDSATIANLLYKTSGLDASSLTSYLSRRSNKAILRSYLDRFGFKGMRIDTALRLFLVVVRVPLGTTAAENLLSTFASRWFDANKGVVSFDRDLTLHLVSAMMQLNNALHQSSNSPGGRPVTPNSSRIVARDFIYAFRDIDKDQMVTDDLLQKVYVSIRNERLVQGLGSSEREQAISISISPLPSSLVARLPSEPITITIPKADPLFRIHLHGQDLFFDPPTLDFARSNEASFVIIGSTLGRRDMLLVRSGANAAKYHDLPLSCPVSVERPFMPNTFTVSFPASSSVPTIPPTNLRGPSSPPRVRKYRFNVVDEVEHQKWTTELPKVVAALQQDDDLSPPSVAPQSTAGASQPNVRIATEKSAIHALREALVVQGDGYDGEDETIAIGRPAKMQQNTQQAKPTKGTQVIATCEQNSLIPSVLSFLQSAKEPQGVGGGGLNLPKNNGSRGNGRI